MVGLGTESLFVQRAPDAFEVCLKVACLDLMCREEACACCLAHRKAARLPRLGRSVKQSMESTLGQLLESSLATHGILMCGLWMVLKWLLRSNRSEAAPQRRKSWEWGLIPAQDVPSLTSCSHQWARSSDHCLWPPSAHWTRQGLGSIRAGGSGAPGQWSQRQDWGKAITAWGQRGQAGQLS